MDAAAPFAQKFKIITPLKKEKNQNHIAHSPIPSQTTSAVYPAAGVDRAVEEILHRLSPDESWCLFLMGYLINKNFHRINKTAIIDHEITTRRAGAELL
jgi:hypothetical protein